MDGCISLSSCVAARLPVRLHPRREIIGQVAAAIAHGVPIVTQDADYDVMPGVQVIKI
jgi:predicted nucleic acid-binding protein